MPSVWVSVASAVPQAASSPHAALPWVLSGAASRAEKQSHSSLKKKPKTFLLPKGKILLGAPCLCAPAEISVLWRSLGCWMGSAAVALCSAVVANVATHGGKPAGCLQCQPGSVWTPGEMRSSKLSMDGCTLVPQPRSVGSVLQPMSSPLP